MELSCDDRNKVSRRVWLLTRRLRSQLNHGTRSCFQRPAPFTPESATVVQCAACSDVHGHLLMNFMKRLDAKPDVDALLETVSKNIKSWFFDARDAWDSHRDLTVRLERVAKRPWYSKALPDPTDQQLILKVLYFLRSGDEPGVGGVVPIERFAKDLGVEVDECRIRMLLGLASLRRAKARFVERNVDFLMDQRGVELACVEDIDKHRRAG